jgi:hypothetical protein
MNRTTRSLASLSVAVVIAISTGFARADGYDEAAKPSGEAMAGDIIFVRPLGLAATLVGTATFLIGLPFTIPSGSVSDSAKALIAEPAKYTFARPLGVDQAKPLPDTVR